MPSTSLDRRRVLAAGGLFLSAALGGYSRALSAGDDDTSRRLVLTLPPLDGSLCERYAVDLSETRPPWDEKAFDATLNGSAFTTRGHTPFLSRGDDEPTYARRNGTYYYLDSLVVGEETVMRPVLRLYEADDEATGTEPWVASAGTSTVAVGIQRTPLESVGSTDGDGDEPALFPIISW